jgi:hypothetical protein
MNEKWLSRNVHATGALKAYWRLRENRLDYMPTDRPLLELSSEAIVQPLQHTPYCGVSTYLDWNQWYWNTFPKITSRSNDSIPVKVQSRAAP